MVVILLILCFISVAQSAEILAVFPHPGKTHVDVFKPLILQLAARGHSLTVLSFFPEKSPRPNYTDISLVGEIPIFMSAVPFELVKDLKPSVNFAWTMNIGYDTCQTLLKTKQVQELIKSGKKYDLIIVELFNSDCFYGLVEVLQAPYIGISSCMTFPHHHHRTGNPDSLPYASNVMTPYSRFMSFTERLMNTLYTLAMQMSVIYYYQRNDQKVVDREVGTGTSLEKTTRDMSLVLVNAHHSIHGARPLVPGLIEVGGLNIVPAKPITDKDLEKFLNEAPEGVLLFSMGSVLQSSSFPDDKRQAFMDAFAELPVRVLMKWENDTLPGKPDNVRLSRWLPQRDVLAHPKIRAFMGHGGLLSTSEAVYCGVPMVLIPMFGDQPNNVAHLQSTGAAVRLIYSEISKETVLQALRAVLEDPSYKKKATELSVQYRDRPMAPLDLAVYWTEYVIRHKGARHLRSAAVDMPWYQLWLLDVIAALLASFALTLWLLVWLIRRAIRLVSNFIWPETSLRHRKND